MLRNSESSSRIGIVAVLFVAASMTSLRADDAAAKESHAAAESDHVKWLEQLRTMRVEHRRALAALKRLESEILEHEADLEEQIAEIEAHRRHIESHEAEIAAGHAEKSRDDHDEIEKRHAQIAKAMKTAHQDHKDLISGLMKFVNRHLEKFHHHDED